jgi:hypothetical protein
VIDENRLREKAAAGATIREHLSAIHAALDAVGEDYAKAMLDCHDRDERDNLWRAARVCRKLKEHFGTIASSGTMASHQLVELQRLR